MHDRLTTVIAPADDQILVDPGVVAGELGISDSFGQSEIIRFVTQASKAAANYCNRVFKAETVRDEFWPQRDPFPRLIAGGLRNLQLSRYPVGAVNMVIENAVELVQTSDYRVDYPNGQLIRLDSYGWPRSWPAFAIAAEYSAGYDQVPDDLQDAVTRMVKSRWYARQRDPMLKGEVVPDVGESQYWVNLGSSSGNMPPDVIDILDNYRAPVTVSAG